MTTNDFFNLPLGMGLTASELYNIADALFITTVVYKKEGLNGTANDYEELRKKIHLYLKENVKIHY